MAEVAALYVEQRTHYQALGADCFDATRDARTYSGPHPIVAHPPCGPWGRLSHFCTKDDAELARTAVRQVRQFGGVLEHPAHSRLWAEFGLPLPETLFTDQYGGNSYEVDQGDYGHRAPKRTWLYAVRLGPCPFRAPCGFDPGFRINNMGAPERRRTPQPFAALLLAWAGSAHASR